jgi:hypothetical protein
VLRDPAVTSLVFDQRYEHAGAPYTDGRKVFLRTELVVEVSTGEHDPEIAGTRGAATRSCIEERRCEIEEDED